MTPMNNVALPQTRRHFVKVPATKTTTGIKFLSRKPGLATHLTSKRGKHVICFRMVAQSCEFDEVLERILVALIPSPIQVLLHWLRGFVGYKPLKDWEICSNVCCFCKVGIPGRTSVCRAVVSQCCPSRGLGVVSDNGVVGHKRPRAVCWA